MNIDEDFYSLPDIQQNNSFIFYVERPGSGQLDKLHIKNLLLNQETVTGLYSTSGFYNDISIFNCQIFYCGGLISINGSNKETNDCCVVDLRSFPQLTNNRNMKLNNRRSCVSLISTTKFIFCLGGKLDGVDLNHCEYYSNSNQVSWVNLKPLNQPNSFITSVFVNPDLIYVLGGRSNKKCEMFNINNMNDGWKPVEFQNSFCRSLGATFMLNKKRILIFGGDLAPSEKRNEFVILNPSKIGKNNFEIKVQSFIAKWSYSTRPTYFRSELYVVSESRKKYCIINPLNLKYEEKNLNF